MATITDFTDISQSPEGVNTTPWFAQRVIDFAQFPAASADTVQAINVAAGTLVKGTGLYLVTAEGGTSTCELGDGVDPDGYQTLAFNLNGAPGLNQNGVIADAYPALGGKLYAADDTIDLLLSANAVDTAKVVVFAWGVTIVEAK